MDSNENNYGGMLAMLCNDLSSIKSRISAGMKFHDTRYASELFNRQIPRIVKTLERIAVGIEEHNKLLSKADGSKSVENIDTKE